MGKFLSGWGRCGRATRPIMVQTPTAAPNVQRLTRTTAEGTTIPPRAAQCRLRLRSAVWRSVWRS
eukprot:12124983-Alexandrium_andersonii.AAC.1